MGEDDGVGGYVHYIMSSFFGALLVTPERLIALAVQAYLSLMATELKSHHPGTIATQP